MISDLFFINWFYIFCCAVSVQKKRITNSIVIPIIRYLESMFIIFRYLTALISSGDEDILTTHGREREGGPGIRKRAVQEDEQIRTAMGRHV